MLFVLLQILFLCLIIAVIVVVQGEDYNKGLYNHGLFNKVLYNHGLHNKGLFNHGLFNKGLYNHGLHNKGLYNGDN